MTHRFSVERYINSHRPPMQTDEEEKKKGKSDDAVERLINSGDCGCARCNKT